MRMIAFQLFCFKFGFGIIPDKHFADGSFYMQWLTKFRRISSEHINWIERIAFALIFSATRIGQWSMDKFRQSVSSSISNHKRFSKCLKIKASKMNFMHGCIDTCHATSIETEYKLLNNLIIDLHSKCMKFIWN